MAVTDFAELAAAASKPYPIRASTLREGDSTLTGTDVLFVNGQFVDDLTRDGFPESEAGPTTADALSYSTDTDRSIFHPAAATGDVWVGSIGQAGMINSASVTPPSGMLIDLLAIQGGLETNITTSQTTNLPTAALPTRATGGAGVWMAAYCFTSWASTDTTVTVTYTNQAGTGSQTTDMRLTDTVTNSQFQIVPLAAGDTGVRSVESVQLSAASGTGNWGIFLFKPLVAAPAMSGNVDFPYLGGWNTTIEDEAVLMWLPTKLSTAVGITQTTMFSFIEV